MYTTLKILKLNNPFLPIVDYSGSIIQRIRYFSADIVGTPVHFVQNSQRLGKDLGEIYLEEDEMFISHDTVLLFTNLTP